MNQGHFQEEMEHREWQRLVGLNYIGIGAVLLTVGLTSWVFGAELAKNPADKPSLQPEFLAGSHVGVIVPLFGSYSLLALRPLDFCLNGKNSCCTCISVRSEGQGRTGKERQRHSQRPRHPDKGLAVTFPCDDTRQEDAGGD